MKERLVAGVQADGTAIVGVDDDWCAAAADRIAACRQAAACASRCAGRCPTASMSRAKRSCRPRAAARAPIARIGGIGSLRGVHNAQNAACAAGAALALGLSLARDPAGPALVSRPRAPHGAGRPQGPRAVRQRFEGDQCRFRRAGAGLLRRHFLDRGRQAEDRRHRLARGLFPAHPQGLPDRRGGGRLRRPSSRARCRT